MSLCEPTVILGIKKALPKLQYHPVTCLGLQSIPSSPTPAHANVTSQGYGSLGIVVLLGQHRGSKLEEQMQL